MSKKKAPRVTVRFLREPSGDKAARLRRVYALLLQLPEESKARVK